MVWLERLGYLVPVHEHPGDIHDITLKQCRHNRLSCSRYNILSVIYHIVICALPMVHIKRSITNDFSLIQGSLCLTMCLQWMLVIKGVMINWFVDRFCNFLNASWFSLEFRKLQNRLTNRFIMTPLLVISAFQWNFKISFFSLVRIRFPESCLGETMLLKVYSRNYHKRRFFFIYYVLVILFHAVWAFPAICNKNKT